MKNKYVVGMVASIILGLGVATSSYAMQTKVDNATLVNEAYEKDGYIMVPLRETAEAMGYEVTWNEDDKNVTVKKGVLETRVTFGSQVYGLIKEEVNLGQIAEVINEKTFVPVNYFKNVLNSNTTVSDNEVKFTTEKITYAQHDKEVDANVGDKVLIIVKGAPKTGYDWTPLKEELKFIEKRTYNNVANDSNSPEIMTFVYEAEMVGSHNIEIEYKNQDKNKKDVLAKATYTINVK